MVFAQFADRPETLLHGQGWGQAGETFVRYLTASGATTYDKSWDLVFRDYLHTHDYALEALLAGGIAALVLALLAVAMASLWCRRRHLALAVPFAAVLSGVAAFWFELPMTMPAVVLAFVTLARPMPARPSPAIRRALAAGLPLLAAASFAAGAFLLRFGLEVQAALARPVPVRASAGAPCLDFPAEGWRGDIALRYAMVGSYQKLTRSGAPLDMTQVRRAAAFACEVDRRSRDSRSALLASAGLLLRSELAFRPDLVRQDPVFARELADWATRLRQFLALAPDRSDLAIPYFGWRLKAGDSAAVAALAADILARRPADPVGLWFSGLIMIESPDRPRVAAGLFRLRQALEAGIERLMPIDPRQKGQILALARRAEAAGAHGPR